MASPRTASARPLAASERRYRRSSFNGARQLSAAQAPTRRILVLLGLLAVALLAAVAVIVGTHLTGPDTSAAGSAGSAAAIHPASY